MKDNPFDIMTLCDRCRGDYETGRYYLRRTYTEKDGMEKCTKCPRYGWEYKITPITRKEGR